LSSQGRPNRSRGTYNQFYNTARAKLRKGWTKNNACLWLNLILHSDYLYVVIWIGYEKRQRQANDQEGKRGEKKKTQRETLEEIKAHRSKYRFVEISVCHH
jgi:hypothetical protein